MLDYTFDGYFQNFVFNCVLHSLYIYVIYSMYCEDFSSSHDQVAMDISAEMLIEDAQS